MSDRLRGIWDAERDAPITWQHAFERAKAQLVVRLTSDADFVASMTWEEFRNLQGWHENAND